MSDTKQGAAARRLSRIARRIYEDAGCPGASVEYRDGAYVLLEPSPNAWATEYRTAADCRAALLAVRHQFRSDGSM